MNSADSIRDLFDRIAPVYDSLNTRLSLGQHWIWKQMAVKWSEAKPGHIGLDVCCGSGDMALMLAQRVGPSGRVIGLDFSREQLAIAAQRSGHLPITWEEGDALNLPFQENCFDAATMGYGLRNLVDIPKGLQELYRVLKPGAKAAILDLHRPTHPMVQAFQSWYLRTIVVPTAQQFDMSAEYEYLAPSLERFPTGPEQVAIARGAGFTATHYPIAGGTMGVLVVTK